MTINAARSTKSTAACQAVICLLSPAEPDFRQPGQPQPVPKVLPGLNSLGLV